MLKRLLFVAILLTSVRCATPGPTVPSGATTGNEAGLESTGSIDKEGVRRVIRDHIVQIRHCYEKELKTNPKIEGKLLLNWDIGELGQVKRVIVVQPLHPAVDACVAATVKTWLFPSPPKGQMANITFPFVFSSNPRY